MRKFYVGAFAIVCSMGVFAENIESVVSLSLVNLTHERMNATYTDSKENIIKIETSEPQYKGDDTFLYRTTTDNPLQCVNQTPSETMSDYGFIALRGFMNAKYAQSPSILITLPTTGNITAIQLLGFASGGGGSSVPILSGFSSTGTAESNFETNWDDPALSGDPAFSLLRDGCATEDDNKRVVPSNAKYAKLIVTESFGDLSVSDMNASPLIYAIRFFAKDTPTSIESKDEAPFSFELFDRNLQINEIANVCIYEITGKVVAQYNNIDNAYLKHLENGIYIIKATNKNGQQTTKKVVIK